MLRRSVPILLTAALSLGATRAPAVVRYDIDPTHSTIGFRVKNLAVNTVPGRFARFEGEILLDDKDVRHSRVNVSIDVASIDTGIRKRDEHLRSEDFFDVARFPSAAFTGAGVEKRGDRLELVGDLTIRDVTRRVRIPFEMTAPARASDGSERIQARGAVTIDRFDYGLKWNRFTEGVQVVSQDVEVELDLEATRVR